MIYFFLFFFFLFFSKENALQFPCNIASSTGGRIINMGACSGCLCAGLGLTLTSLTQLKTITATGAAAAAAAVGTIEQTSTTSTAAVVSAQTAPLSGIARATVVACQWGHQGKEQSITLADLEPSAANPACAADKEKKEKNESNNAKKNLDAIFDVDSDDEINDIDDDNNDKEINAGFEKVTVTLDDGSAQCEACFSALAFEAAFQVRSFWKEKKRVCCV